MLDYNAALAVATIVRLGSFERAAKALNVTPSAISQRVKQLEERLGAVLVERGIPCRATEKGAWLCRHMELVGQLESDLLDQLPEIGDSTRKPVTLDLAVNADSLGTWFLPAIAGFTQRSDVLLNIAVDDQDHTVDWLQTGRVLAAVTSTSQPSSGCSVSALGKLRYVATASSAFIKRHFANGVTAEAIAHAPMLTFNQKDTMQRDWLGEQLKPSPEPPTHWLPSTHGFVTACILGIGWGLNPVDLVKSHIASGQLVELIPGTSVDVPLYWQASRWAQNQFPELTKQVVGGARTALLQH